MWPVSDDATERMAEHSSRLQLSNNFACLNYSFNVHMLCTDELYPGGMKARVVTANSIGIFKKSWISEFKLAVKGLGINVVFVYLPIPDPVD